MDSDFINEYGLIIVAAIIGLIVVGFTVGALKEGGVLADLIQQHDTAIGG